MKKLSIIIPVYNVEKYIRDCILSIYDQNLHDEDFEVILVNDGTEDNSFEVIQDILTQHDNIIRVDQDNQGLSVARNTGIKNAKGEYVLFVDSDDVLVRESVGPLLLVANTSYADLVVADFLKLSDEEIRNYKIEEKDDSSSVTKTGFELFLDDLDPSQNYVWRTMYRREFLLQNNLSFIPGICYEDIPFTPECYLKARVCVRVNSILYLYRMRPSSITSNMDKNKAMDLNKAIERIWELKKMKGLNKEIRRRLMDNLFSTFSFELWCISHNKNVYMYKKEIIADLNERVPDLWFKNNLKQLIVSLLFRMMPELYLSLRSN